MYKLEVIFYITHMNHDGYCSGAEVECMNDQYDDDELRETEIMDIPDYLQTDSIAEDGNIDIDISGLNKLDTRFQECMGSGYCNDWSTRRVLSARIIPYQEDGFETTDKPKKKKKGK